MTRKIEKEPLWASSSRPLYPKCIWVEGTGHRNFIFDHDSHIRRNVCNKSKNDSVTKSKSFHSFEENSKNFKLFGLSDVTHEQHYLTNSLYEIHQRPSVERHPIKTSITNVCLMKKQMHHKNPNRKSEKDASSSIKDIDALSQEMKDNQIDDTMDLSQNQLTERVLQWLDLAGRQTLVRPESDIVKPTPLSSSSRRIFTAGEHNKKYQRHSALKRSESVHHLSITFNDNSDTNLMDFKNKFSDADFVPNRSFKKIVQAKQNAVGMNVNNNNADGNSSGTLNNIPATISELDKNGKCTSPDKNKKTMANTNVENVENQYRVMIQRQILESSCNTQLAKRQLHIFIPKLPKKQIITDCDSCLSSSGISKL